MIALLRIDERLIHGQVATSWSKALDIDTIVCASDEAAQNPLKKKMLLYGKKKLAMIIVMFMKYIYIH